MVRQRVQSGAQKGQIMICIRVNVVCHGQEDQSDQSKGQTDLSVLIFHWVTLVCQGSNWSAKGSSDLSKGQFGRPKSRSGQYSKRVNRSLRVSYRSAKGLNLSFQFQRSVPSVIWSFKG